jgi:uncharacterized protein with HEPN domain
MALNLYLKTRGKRNFDKNKKTDERVVIVSLTTLGEAIKEKKCIPQQLVEALNISFEELAQLKV